MEVWSKSEKSSSPCKKIDVVLVMEGLKLVRRRASWLEHVHLLVQAVTNDEVVCEGEAVRLHRMPFLWETVVSKPSLGQKMASLLRSDIRQPLSESSRRLEASSGSARRK
jgi:hypothetical protein